MASERMTSTQDIIDMVDLFYVHKKMHNRLKARRNSIEEMEHPTPRRFAAFNQFQKTEI